MKQRRPTWRDRYPNEVTCVRCLEVREQAELDRMLWCERCRALARARATRWGWMAGLVFAAGIAVYVWVVIKPTVVVAAWIATVVAAAWIGSKVARELIYGAMRFRNAHAVDAMPPGTPDSERDA